MHSTGSVIGFFSMRIVKNFSETAKDRTQILNETLSNGPVTKLFKSWLAMGSKLALPPYIFKKLKNTFSTLFSEITQF
jgi:hypothetical protein